MERVEVKDVSVPEQLQRSLASAAEAEREARAKVCALLRNQKIFEHEIKLCAQVIVVIMEKAPTRSFSWLKAATTAFTFITLLGLIDYY